MGDVLNCWQRFSAFQRGEHRLDLSMESHQRRVASRRHETIWVVELDKVRRRELRGGLAREQERLLETAQTERMRRVRQPAGEEIEESFGFAGKEGISAAAPIDPFGDEFAASFRGQTRKSEPRRVGRARLAPRALNLGSETKSRTAT
jgi:hypothetical protein